MKSTGLSTLSVSGKKYTCMTKLDYSKESSTHMVLLEEHFLLPSLYFSFFYPMHFQEFPFLALSSKVGVSSLSVL